MAKTATAKTEAPRETAAQVRARERAEARATRDRVRQEFRDHPEYVSTRELAAACDVDPETAFNALTKGQHSQFEKRLARKQARESREQTARIRRLFRELKPDDLERFAVSCGTYAHDAYSRLTKGQQATFERRIDRVRAREDRVRARERAREERADARLTERFERKSARAARCARLPEGARPSKVTAKSDGRPMLSMARITRIGRGEKARWMLDVTDSYRLVRFPLELAGESGVRDGQLLSHEALVAVEKAGGFRVKGQIVQPVTATREVRYGGHTWDNSSGRSVRNTGEPRRYYEWRAVDTGPGYEVLTERKTGRFPKLAQLVPKSPPKTKRIEVSLDPGLLSQLADAVSKQSKATAIRLVIDTRKVEKTDSGRHVNGPILVEPYGDGQTEGIVALQMPFRSRP